MKFLSDIDVSDKRVFLRADLDVPLREVQVTNDERLTTNAEIATRLTNLKPTVDYLLEHGVSRIIIAGHIDRPKGPDPEFSTKKLLPILEKILGRGIAFSEQLTTDNLQLTEEKKSGVSGQVSIVLLENLRFWSGEEKNEHEFAQKLALLADIYVNEAFGNCHRNHVSMVALAQLLPHGAGLHLEKEVEVLSKLLKNPVRPYVAIVGGVKIETKLPVIENMAKLADWVLVGGAIAKEFPNSKLQTPNSNVIVATSEAEDKDIDQKSIDKFKEVITAAKTVVWNGPMGVFEEGFDKGTRAIAQAIIQLGAYSVVGGGETAQFLAQNNLLSKFSFVSSGGGAMLEFLSGHQLPGIKALE